MKSNPKYLFLSFTVFLSLALTATFAAPADKTPARKVAKTNAYSIVYHIGPCDGVNLWGSTFTYSGGEVVVYKGNLYISQWWTQGEAPDTNSGAPEKVWVLLGACGS